MDVNSEARNFAHKWAAISIVASCTGVTMYAMTNLFPYVGFMVSRFRGLGNDGAGYAAGYVASSFYLGRFLSSYYLGYLSDHVGRKPVMIVSMSAVGILSLAFGVSETLLWAVTCRFLMGLMCGTTIAGRALVPELAGPTRVVEGMAQITGSYALGLTIGPALGAILSEPTKHFPSIFAAIGLLERYPYLLPNILCALGALFCIPLVILFVPETKMRKGCCGRRPARRPADPSAPTETELNQFIFILAASQSSRLRSVYTLRSIPLTPFLSPGQKRSDEVDDDDEAAAGVEVASPALSEVRTVDGGEDDHRPPSPPRSVEANDCTLYKTPARLGCGSAHARSAMPPAPSRLVISPGQGRSVLLSADANSVESATFGSSHVSPAHSRSFRTTTPARSIISPAQARCLKSPASTRAIISPANGRSLDFSTSSVSLVSPAHTSSVMLPAHSSLRVCSGHNKKEKATKSRKYRRSHVPLARSHSDAGDGDKNDDQGDDDGQAAEYEQPGIFGAGGLLQVRKIPSLLLATGLLEVVVVSFHEIYPLWALSSKRAGGLDWNIVQIGEVLFVAGITQVLHQFVGYTRLVEWFGLVTYHRTVGVAAAVLNAAVPLIGYIPWDNAALFVISSVTIALLNCSSYALMTAIMVSSTNPVPPRLRGKLAGVMTMSQCFAGAIGPASFAIFFAWSISPTSSASEIPLVNQHLVFNLGALIRILLLAILWHTLTVETMAIVAVDPPSPGSTESPSQSPSTELESIRESDGTASPEIGLDI